MATFGEIVEENLAERRRTKVWLAEETGINYSTLRDRLTKKEAKLSADEFFKILKALDLDFTDFVDCSPAERMDFEFHSKIRRDPLTTLIDKAEACMKEIRRRWGEGIQD